MRTIASFPIGRALLRRAGVSPAQYQLLVDLFGQLGERKELFGSLGLDRHAMRLTSLMLLLPGGFLALMALGDLPLGVYSLRVLSFSSFILLLLIVMEAANSFFNPAEVTVLAHQPIAGSTYLAAKASYLTIVVLRAEAALNGPAAFAGLLNDDARWFYPATHLAAAAGAGLLVALLTCAFFGVLFRFVPAARVRSAALWVQILVISSPMLLDLSARRLARSAARAPDLDWSFLPVTWFGALAVAGQAPPAVPLGMGVLAGTLICAVFVAYGTMSLSAGYMTRIVGVLRAAGRQGRGVARSSLGGRLTARLAGSPAGQAAYGFLHPMMRRDWQFRRAAVQSLVLVVLFAPAMILSARAVSPFAAGLRRPPLIGIFPELLAFVTLGVTLLLPFSDHYRARWIFAIAPARERYIRGVYWALWLPLAALPFVALAVGFSFYWGVIDAVLFAVYGLAVASLLLAAQLFFIEGLPFGRPPRAERSYVLLPFVLFGPVVIGLAWLAQVHFLFLNRWATLAAAAVSAGLAGLIARFTLKLLAARVRRDLELRGANGLFGRTAETDDRLG